MIIAELRSPAMEACLMNEYGSRGSSERGDIEPRRLRQGVGSLLDWEPFRGFFPSNWQHMFAIDVNRKDGNYEIEMPVPGFKPEDIELTYQDGVLTVTGKNERRSFTRSLSVPDDVDEDSIEANVEHGVLSITLRQHPKRQARRISIGTGQRAQTTTGTTQAPASTSKPS
jgi:HSP20 family protein